MMYCFPLYDELIKQIENLLDAGMGDPPRLTAIIERLKKGKELYSSDQQYVDDLISRYLFPSKTVKSEDNAFQESKSIPSDIYKNRLAGAEKSNYERKTAKKKRSKKKSVGIVIVCMFVGLIVFGAGYNASNQTINPLASLIVNQSPYGHYTLIENDTVNWYFHDSKGNNYHWYIPMSTYDAQVRIDTSLLVGTQNLALRNGTQILAQNYAPLAQALVSNHGFSKVIDQVYDNAGSDDQFIYEVWYISAEMTTYNQDITDSNLTPFEVLTRGEGDCKDKSILIASLLRSSEHTTNWKINLEEMDINNPGNPQTMNHMIVIVDTGQKTYAIESTATPDSNAVNYWAGTNIYGWQIPV